MSDINGLVKKQATLTTGAVQKITFNKEIQNVTLLSMGTAKVAFKVNADVASVSDDTSNYLNPDFPGAEIEKVWIDYISLVSDANVTIQWAY